jgi:hypothetical protein
MKLLNFLISSITLSALISCNTQEKNTPEVATQNKILSNITSKDTSGQLMKEDAFWKIIDSSLVVSDSIYEEQIVALTEILTTLDTNEIIKFDNTYTALLGGSYDYKLWGASYVINGGCSADCFDYFREYLIAHGKKVFYETLNDPESCVRWVTLEETENLECISYSISEAYKQKTGRNIPITYQPKFELKGESFDEETVYEQYPKLARKFLINSEEED